MSSTCGRATTKRDLTTCSRILKPRSASLNRQLLSIPISLSLTHGSPPRRVISTIFLSRSKHESKKLTPRLWSLCVSSQTLAKAISRLGFIFTTWKRITTRRCMSSISRLVHFRTTVTSVSTSPQSRDDEGIGPTRSLHTSTRKRLIRAIR